MNTYRICLLTVAICAAVSFSNLAAAGMTSVAKATKSNKSTPAKLMAPESRFGRNVRTEDAKALKRSSLCKSPGTVCECKAMASGFSCEVKLLKRR